MRKHLYGIVLALLGVVGVILLPLSGTFNAGAARRDAGVHHTSSKTHDGNQSSRMERLAAGKRLEQYATGVYEKVWARNHAAQIAAQNAAWEATVAQAAAAQQAAASQQNASTQAASTQQSQPAQAAASAPVASTPTSSASGGAGGNWSALANCESGGNYSENSGNGYYGAYQFSQQTWNSLGYSGNPADASPAEQDAAAQALQASGGWSQWPSCSSQLGL